MKFQLMVLRVFVLVFALQSHATNDLCRLSLKRAETVASTFLERATFGPEFTFTNSKLLWEPETSGFPVREKFFLKAREKYQELCRVRQDCSISLGSDKHGGNFRVTYNDGWYFEVGIDNNVIETQTVKSTYQQFLKNKNRLQSDLFNMMKNLGLVPDQITGGGHIHVGAEFFLEDPLLFRNFFVDYANHPQLTMGIFGDKDPNYPPIVLLKPHQQEGFTKALENFDSQPSPTLKSFIWNIHSQVYTEPFTPAWGGGAYYQAIRLERMFWINGAATFELRGFRPQKSMDEFLLELELIGARMDYLKNKNELVSFRFQNETPDFSAQSIVDTFYRYTTEAGLDWNRYKTFLPIKLKFLKPSKNTLGK